MAYDLWAIAMTGDRQELSFKRQILFTQIAVNSSKPYHLSMNKSISKIHVLSEKFLHLKFFMTRIQINDRNQFEN